MAERLVRVSAAGSAGTRRSFPSGGGVTRPCLPPAFCRSHQLGRWARGGGRSRRRRGGCHFWVLVTAGFGLENMSLDPKPPAWHSGFPGGRHRRPQSSPAKQRGRAGGGERGARERPRREPPGPSASALADPETQTWPVRSLAVASEASDAPSPEASEPRALEPQHASATSPDTKAWMKKQTVRR